MKRPSCRIFLHFGALLTIASFPLFNCAYLNTYYNGKTAFNTARREHQKFLRGIVDDSVPELPAQTAGLYDRAISKSLKVLEVYPKSKKWHDDAVYLMSRAAYYKGEYATAIRRLKRLHREFPESPFIPESYVYLGKSYFENDNLVKAEETCQIVLEKYPYLNNNEEITFLLAKVAIKREGKAQAIELLSKTLATVQTPEKKMEILLKMARLYMDLHQWGKAIDVLQSSPRKRGAFELMYQIDLSLLICRGELEQYDKALELAGQMLKSRYYIIHYPEIQLRKGRIFQKAGRTREAVDIYEQITRAILADTEIQGEAWYELALIYQHNYGDLKKAKECYEKAMSLSKKEKSRVRAQSRITALTDLALYRELLGIEMAQADTADSADSADTTISEMPVRDTAQDLHIVRYKMGEIFWLRLEEPDSALRHFDFLTADTTVNDTIQTQALYARAWITLHMKQDSVTADSLFDLIISAYPASYFAKRCQMELGIPVTVQTREDSGHVAFLKAEKLYFEDNDALKASRAYLMVAKAYPDLDVGPKSIYAAAWLCDEVLHKNVTARKLYRTLCDSFPQSDLCLKQAKPRLQVVEDTLQELKSKKGKIKDGQEAEPAELEAEDIGGDGENEDSESNVSESSETISTEKPPVDSASVKPDSAFPGRPPIPYPPGGAGEMRGYPGRYQGRGNYMKHPYYQGQAPSDSSINRNKNTDD